MCIPSSKELKKWFFGGILVVCLGITAFVCAAKVADMPIIAKLFLYSSIGPVIVASGVVMIWHSLQPEPDDVNEGMELSSGTEQGITDAGTESDEVFRISPDSDVAAVNAQGGNDAPVDDSQGGNDAPVDDSQGGNDAPVDDSQGGNDAPVGEVASSDSAGNSSNGDSKNLVV